MTRIDFNIPLNWQTNVISGQDQDLCNLDMIEITIDKNDQPAAQEPELTRFTVCACSQGPNCSQPITCKV